MANRRQRAARRLEENQDHDQDQEQKAEPEQRKEPAAGPPAGKPESARKWFLLLWGIPLVLFVVVAVIKG